MLKLNASFPYKIIEKPIFPAASIDAEGKCLVQHFHDGEECVEQSFGAGGQLFVGFSFATNLVPSILSRVELHTIPAVPGPYTVQLDRNNLIAANLFVYGVTEVAPFAEGNPAAVDDEWSCVDATGLMTFNVADAGQIVRCTYRYTPTVAEVKFMYPDANININPAFEFLGSIGVIVHGEIFTDQYDASINWSINTPANTKTGALGVVAGTGGDCVIPGGRIIHVPSIDNPFLGLAFVSA